MIACPYLKNKQQRDSFNELIAAAGETAAYDVWNKNNGNEIEKAPNGEPSILFKSLIDSGLSREEAIKQKILLYSIDYIDRNGDWINSPEDYIGDLDKNGEPIISAQKKSPRKPGSGVFSSYTIAEYVGDELSQNLLDGKSVSSASVLQQLDDKQLTMFANPILVDILKRHDVPIILQDIGGGVLMQTVFDKNGGSFIQIDPKVVENISATYFAISLLHEILHSLTGNLFSKQTLTKTEQRVVNSTKELFDIFTKLFPEEFYSRVNYEDGYYALSSLEEFIATFSTDANVRKLFYQKAALTKNKGIINKIKTFINSVSNFLVNKNAFKTVEDRVQEYDSALKNYLLSQSPIIRGNITDEYLYNQLYPTMDNSVLSEDYRAELAKRFKYYQEQLKKLNIKLKPSLDLHKPLQFTPRSADDMKKLTVDQLREYFSTSLTQRLAAVKASQLPQDEKAKLSVAISDEITRFESKSNRLIDVIGDFAASALEDLTKDVDYIAGLQNSIGQWSPMNADEYMMIKHTNVGVYLNLFKQLSSSLTNNAVLSHLREEGRSAGRNERQVESDIAKLKEYVNAGKQVAEEADEYLKSILCKSVTATVIDTANKTHDISVAELIDDIENNSISFDQNSLFTSIYSLDATTDPVLKTLNSLITEALTVADKRTYEATVKMIKLIKKLNSVSDMQVLYEKDEKGNATQYIIRRLNYGKMLSDYKAEIRRLNVKYGLPEDSRTRPTDDDKRRQYEDELEDWLELNVERPFTSAYYRAQKKLSPMVKKLRGDVLIEISALNRKAVNPSIYGDDYYHYDLLTKQELSRYNELQMYLRILKSNVDEHGNRKDGEALAIAKELQQLDEDLYKGDEPEYDYDAWNNARNKMIKECGGKAAMNSGDKKAFNWKKFNAWERLNTVQELKRTADGKILLFDFIDNQIDYDYSIIYEDNGDGGKHYEELKNTRNDILANYRDKFSGDINADIMPAELKKKIRDIEREMSKIKKRAINKNKGLRQASAQRSKLLKKYVQWEKSAIYKEQLAYYKSLGEDEYEIFLRNTGYGNFDDPEFPWRPYSFFTTMVVKPEYAEQFVNIKPGRGFMKKDSRSYLNKNYDQSFGEYMVPKNISRYLNKLFDKVKSGPLKDLYDEVLNTISQITTLYGLQNGSQYQLPAITGGMITFLRGRGDKLSKLFEYASESLGIDTDAAYRQSTDFEHSSDELLEKIDEIGETLTPSRTVGSMPDGRELRMIPRHYMRKLENPHAISRDLIYMLMESLKLANRFAEKSKIKSSCEMLMDYMADRKIYINKGTDKEGNEKIEVKRGSESKAYSAGQRYLDMNLYGIRQQKVKIAGVDVTKAAMGIRNYSTLLNLGYKPTIAVVGALTSLAASYVLAVVGTDYGQREFLNSIGEVFWQQIKSIFTGNGIAKSDTTNKMEACAELFDITNQAERKVKFTNTNRSIRAARNNGAFSFMTFADFYTKSSIMIATLMSMRYFDGRFVSLEDIRNSESYYKMSDKEFKPIEKLFDEQPSLWSMLEIDKNGVLTILDASKRTAFENDFVKIKSRIQKRSEKADGMPTEQQKSAFAASVFGSFVLQHRQFLPLMLQNRFSQMTYDQDTQQWSNGIFLTIGDIYCMALNSVSIILRDKSKKIGFGFKVPHKEDEKATYKVMSYMCTLGCASGLALFSPFVGIIGGAAAGVAMGALTAHMKGGSLNKLLDDNETLLGHLKSRARRKHVKQVVTEILLYKTLVLNLVPLLALLFHMFGGDEDDDSWASRIFWLITYTLNKFAWEMYTPYRFDDLLNNIRSATASTSSLDRIDEVKKVGVAMPTFVENTIFPRGTLYDTLKGVTPVGDDADIITNDPWSEYVNRGPYKNGIPYIMDEPFTKRQRAWFKTLPVKNFYEEMYGSKEKNNYFKNQVMREQ